MTVTESRIDTDALSLTFVSDFAATVDRVWQIWQDPRQLERWWGPPGFPATFESHDLSVGGSTTYFMTGPEGEKYRGWWAITAVDAPHTLEFDDGFADDDGRPNPEMPITRATVTLEPTTDGTRMTLVSTFDSLEHLEQLRTMGMEEGMRLGLSQIDAILV